MQTLENSELFHRLEMIGSSILFVYDDDESSDFTPKAWMIDFAKTIELPKIDADDEWWELNRHSSKNSVNNYTVPHELSHIARWEPQNHEDGYLLGLSSLVDLWGSDRWRIG